MPASLAIPAALLAAALSRQPVVRPLATAPIPAHPIRAGDDAAILRDPAADSAARAAAARRLILSHDPDARRTVIESLAPSPQSSDSQTILLAEIAAMPSAPAVLTAPLAALLETAPPENRPRIASALASIRARDAVRALITEAASGPTIAARDAASSALARLTGRSDIGPDATRWAEWFSGVEFLTEIDWQHVLADGLAASADRAARDRDTAISRLLDVNLQRYQDSAQGEPRWTFLTSLLRDDLPRVRRQGVTLAKTELANARAPGPAVSAAALDLLRDPWPDLRRAGAELVESLSPPDGEKSLAEALFIETDEAAAAALLRATRRYPSAALRPMILQWLARPGPAGRAAIDAAAALLDRNLITADDDRAAILRTLRAADPATLTGPGMRLLAELGTPTDRDAVAGLLTSTSPTLRATAADALAASASSTDALITAAQSDESLFAAAARSVALHRRSLDGFLQVLSLPCAGAETRRDALAAIGRTLDPRDILAAARATADPVLREQLLARLESVPLHRPLLPAGPSTPDPAVVAGLLMLAQTRLDLRQPAAALASLDALAPVADSIDQTLSASLRTVALLWLNRIADAAPCAAPASAWLDGLERAAALPHARDIAAMVHARFGPSLSESDAARLRAIEAKFPADPDSSTPPPARPPTKPPG